ncbi:hypothetical protein [Paraglaciecola sp. L3A3]|uniref:hypothetical protein n=1 Tax=Paraglaciecola sp. L3A3 TaxID=2686358 RepID=UPI00131E616C|nr:hypothetical protein [Paraglaciecola sp. L3A3]
MKTKIVQQYKLPIGMLNILALSGDKCVGVGVNHNFENKLVVMQNGQYQILDYEIPKLKGSDIYHRTALFKTDKGFGCVFDNVVVKYSFDNSEFVEYVIKNMPPLDKQGRQTGPLKAVVVNDENDLLVLLEDYFYKSRGKILARLKIGPKVASYEPFFFVIPAKNQSINFECCDIGYQDKILFHVNQYNWKFRPFHNDCSQLFELTKGEVIVINDLNKGAGSFSSDGTHLLVKTYVKPFRIEFFNLSGVKDFEIKLTLKKVLGDVDKVYLSNLDKFGNTLWLCHESDVTEVELF